MFWIKAGNCSPSGKGMDVKFNLPKSSNISILQRLNEGQPYFSIDSVLPSEIHVVIKDKLSGCSFMLVGKREIAGCMCWHVCRYISQEIRSCKCLYTRQIHFHPRNSFHESQILSDDQSSQYAMISFSNPK